MTRLILCFVTALGVLVPAQQALEPFKGITADGEIKPGLFSIRATGVSTKPVKDAADRFLAALTPEQKTKTSFAVDDEEWRRWNNVHRAARQGVSFKEMSEAQREAAYGLMRASFSARGLEQSRNVMRLNGHLAELVKNFEEYGEFLYWITVMGTPSGTEPWGWQLDGHHLAINVFILGDQMVMTPAFLGSEPTVAESGPHTGAGVLQEEQAQAEALMASLDAAQRAAAIVNAAKPGNNAQTQAYRDNVVVPYQGVRATALTPAQRSKLLALAGLFVGNMRDGHAKVKMSEVERHLDDTWFSWVGGTGTDAVFYYRIHSPVILIEFDHQSPVALGARGSGPNRRHVHSVVRTPNGNDYGKDLLRQHYEKHKGDAKHGHAAQSPVFKPGDPGVQPPIIVKEVKPSYPAAAMHERVEGTAWLRAVVDNKGRPRNIEVTKPLESSLDKRAVGALAKWRFAPARKDGKPVAYQLDVQMTFDLRGGRRDLVQDSCRKNGATHPTLIKDVKPQYTGNAMRDRARGTIELDAIVETDGTVTSVRLLTFLHPELDAASIEAFLQSRFKPGMLAGVPIACRVQVEFSFSLR